MNGNRVVSTMLIILLTISVSGQAGNATQGSFMGNTSHRSMNSSEKFHDEPPSNHAELVRPAGNIDKEEPRIHRFDSMVNEKIIRAARKISSACDGNKTWNQKVHVVEKGLWGLFETATKYSHFDPNLKIRTRILLGEIKDVFSESLIVKSDTPLTDWAKHENIFSEFVTYYKFMYNLGDSVTPRDFCEKWARDTAKGLACLYE